MFRSLLKALPVLGRFVRPAGITTAKVARSFTPQELEAARAGVSTFAPTVTKAAPGIIRRALFKGAGTGPIKRYPLVIGGGLAGYGALSKFAFPDQEPRLAYSQEDINRALAMGESGQKLLDDYLKQQTEAINKLYENATGKYSGSQQAALNDYLAGIGGYAGAQGAAIEKAYQDLSEQSRAMAEQAMEESQMAATDIDRLYGSAASQAAGYGAGQGLTTAPSDVSGLTGVSGAMAETPDVTRTYGQSLADWMGRQGIIERQDLESAAQSYLAQGLGTKSQLEAEAAALGSRARYDLASRLAEMDYQAQQQKAQQIFGAQQQYEQAILEQQVADAQLSKAAGMQALRAPELWKVIKEDEGLKDTWAALGVTDAASLRDKLIENPQYLQLLPEV